MYIRVEECYSEMKEICKYLLVFLGRECFSILLAGVVYAFIFLSFKIN